MCRHILVLSALLTMLTACTGDRSDGEAPPTSGVCSSASCRSVDAPAPLGVDLTASQVIGGSVESGSGTGEIEVDRDSGDLRGSVTFDGLEPDAVSLHRGFAGERGPVLVWLDRVSSTEWSLRPSTVLGRSDVDALDAGGLYLEATTAGSSVPAVRGQIIREGITEVRFVRFSGAQVVPTVSSAATAIGAMTINARAESDPVSESFVIHVNSSGLDDIVAVHAHAGAGGTNGPILGNLVQDPDDASHWFSQGSFEPGEAIRDAFDNSTLYFDVHTAAHPDGEIRGQIGRSEDVSFIRLDGDDVVPPVDTSNRGMVAITTTDRGVGWDWAPKINMHVNLTGLDDATAVTINFAALGQDGPAVYSLNQDPDDPSQWSITGAILHLSGISPDSATGGWYVSVATPRFPAGEVRGQIMDHDVLTYNYNALAVTTVNPADGATVKTLPSTITVGFNRYVLADSERIELLASGGDASFNDGNELEIIPVAINVNGPSLTIDLTDVPSQDDTYQLAIERTDAAPVGTPSNNYLSTFAVDAGHQSPPTFQQIQDAIFTPSCAKSGCHSGSRPPLGLDLSAGVAFDNIVDVPSAEEPQRKLIEPGDPSSSYLLSKLDQPAQRSQHTLGEPVLGNATIQKLREWIAAGASND